VVNALQTHRASLLLLKSRTWHWALRESVPARKAPQCRRLVPAPEDRRSVLINTTEGALLHFLDPEAIKIKHGRRSIQRVTEADLLVYNLHADLQSKFG
jgi:hypothetical protein